MACGTEGCPPLMFRERSGGRLLADHAGGPVQSSDDREGDVPERLAGFDQPRAGGCRQWLRRPCCALTARAIPPTKTCNRPDCCGVLWLRGVASSARRIGWPAPEVARSMVVSG